MSIVVPCRRVSGPIVLLSALDGRVLMAVSQYSVQFTDTCCNTISISPVAHGPRSHRNYHRHLRSSPANFRLPTHISATHSHTTTSVTNSLHRHTPPFAKTFFVHMSNPCLSFSSSCNPVGKRAIYLSDPPTGPHQARRVTTKHTPKNTPTALPSHYTKEARFSTITSLHYQLPCAFILGRINSPTRNTRRKGWRHPTYPP
jgi:hypothetical protein